MRLDGVGRPWVRAVGSVSLSMPERYLIARDGCVARGRTAERESLYTALRGVGGSVAAPWRTRNCEGFASAARFEGVGAPDLQVSGAVTCALASERGCLQPPHISLARARVLFIVRTASPCYTRSRELWEHLGVRARTVALMRPP